MKFAPKTYSVSVKAPRHPSGILKVIERRMAEAMELMNARLQWDCLLESDRLLYGDFPDYLRKTKREHLAKIAETFKMATEDDDEPYGQQSRSRARRHYLRVDKKGYYIVLDGKRLNVIVTRDIEGGMQWA